MLTALRSISRSLSALAAGAIAPLSLAPFGLWPLAIISLFVLLTILRSSKPSQAIWHGWVYGLGFYGFGTSWIYHSIHEYGYTPIPLALFLTFLFVAGLALLLSASFTYCYVKYLGRLRWGTLLGFPALWVLFEWLRSWLLTGFPWLYLGYAHVDTWLAGWAPVTGVYGLSLIVASQASLIFCMFKVGTDGWRFNKVIGISALMLPWLLAYPLSQISWSNSQSEPLTITLVQPNISQHVKWLPQQKPRTLQLLRQLTTENLNSDLVIWPENAVPLFLHQAQSYVQEMNTIGETSQTAIVTGIPYWQPQTSKHKPVLHNSIAAFGSGTEGLYHKQKLVPFGEYLPLQQLLRGVIKFFDLPMSNFAPGGSNQTAIHVTRTQGDYSIAPYICYEIVYPDFVRELSRDSNLLLTISDDSWFGSSIGPHQHLQMARMRALENSRYLLRGTNTGLTAIVDHQGKILAQATQFEQTHLTGSAQLRSGLTPFMRWGSIPILLFCLLLLVLTRPLRRALPAP